MRTLRSAFAAAVIGTAVLAPAAARAAMITESFTVTVGPPPAVLPPAQDAFPGTAFAQFNPANGTLTDVMTSLTGSGTWTSTSPFPLLTANLEFQNDGAVSNTQDFFAPGTITFNLTGSNTGPSVLAEFTGTGTATVDLVLFAEENGDTFETNGALSGSITYDYTPVPAPLLGTGLGGLASLAVLGLAGVARRPRRPARGGCPVPSVGKRLTTPNLEPPFRVRGTKRSSPEDNLFPASAAP